MVHLARILQKIDKSFRIVTPYDAQRTRIEASLKAEGLKWEDTVFNVDSFQVSDIASIQV
jgi:superfamily I DNA and/or RNA helicase